MTLDEDIEETPGERISFRTISNGDNSGYDTKAEYAIYDKPKLKELWGIHSRVHVNHKPPKIKFKKNMVIAVFLGERMNVGSSIKITDMVKKEDYLEVFVKSRYIDGIFDMVTHPHHIVECERVENVKFRYIK